MGKNEKKAGVLSGKSDPADEGAVQGTAADAVVEDAFAQFELDDDIEAGDDMTGTRDGTRIINKLPPHPKYGPMAYIIVQKERRQELIDKGYVDGLGLSPDGKQEPARTARLIAGMVVLMMPEREHVKKQAAVEKMNDSLDKNIEKAAAKQAGQFPADGSKGHIDNPKIALNRGKDRNG